VDALTWWERHGQPERFHRTLKQVGRGYYDAIVRMRGIDSMLDVGCGFGDTRAWVPDVAYVGVDLTRQFLRSGARSGVRDLAQADAFALPFAARSFDLVTCRALLEHLTDPLPVLAQMSRVSRGLLLLVWSIHPAKRRTRRVHDPRGFWNIAWSRRHIMSGLPGWSLTWAAPYDRHLLWLLEA